MNTVAYAKRVHVYEMLTELKCPKTEIILFDVGITVLSAIHWT